MLLGNKYFGFEDSSFEDYFIIEYSIIEVLQYFSLWYWVKALVVKEWKKSGREWFIVQYTYRGENKFTHSISFCS